MSVVQRVAGRVPAAAQGAALRVVFGLPRAVRRLIAGPPVRRDGQELALDAQLLLRLNSLADRNLVRGTPAEARERLKTSSSVVSGPPIEPVATRGLTVADSLPARLYTPDGLGDDAPLLVYFHGGGWVLGSLDSHDNLCRFLALEAGVKVLSVDYRLAPEHQFPAAADDAVAAFLWAHAHAADLGIDADRIAVGGDSAGGNVSAVIAHRTTRAGGPRPLFQLLLYPATDASRRRRSRELFAEGFFLTSADMDWFLDHYCPDHAARTDDRISVLLAEDLTGLPPAYVATAGFDPLRDEGEAFAAKLTESGVPVALRRHSDLIHGYASFLAAGTRFREAVAEAAGALRVGLALAR